MLPENQEFDFEDKRYLANQMGSSNIAFDKLRRAVNKLAREEVLEAILEIEDQDIPEFIKSPILDKARERYVSPMVDDIDTLFAYADKPQGLPILMSVCVQQIGYFETSKNEKGEEVREYIEIEPEVLKQHVAHAMVGKMDVLDRKRVSKKILYASGMLHLKNLNGLLRKLRKNRQAQSEGQTDGAGTDQSSDVDTTGHPSTE